MLSVAGVQRSETPAQSKHPYPRTTAAGRDSSPIGMTVAIFARHAPFLRPTLLTPSLGKFPLLCSNLPVASSDLQELLECELHIDHLLEYITAVISDRMN